MTAKKDKPSEPTPVTIENVAPVKVATEGKTFGIHNDIWKAFIVMFGGLITTWMTLEIQAGRREQEKTTIAVEESGVKVNSRLDDIGHVVDDVHTLSNANFSTQLKISADAIRLVADMRQERLIANTDPEKVEALTALVKSANIAAENAETALAEHEAKQAIVDAGQKIEMKPRPKPGRKTK